MNNNQNTKNSTLTKEKLLKETAKLDNENVLSEEEVREIYRNATAGKESIEILRPLSEDKGFRSVLLRESKGYGEFVTRIELLAQDNGIDLKGVSPFAKGMMQITTLVNTLTDKSPSKLASIMLQGIGMGEISITKIVNKLEDNGKHCPLADDMLKFLRKNTEEMKVFL